ncbi:MAG: preprotein translocase subunit SecE [Deltaproteobacteria bacterium]|nr:preprotein translocase subunit SecE [Deltaproteobacteria bacterium]
MAQNGKVKGRLAQDSESGSKFSIKQVKEFYADVKSEFGKITWPDKKHTIGACGVMVVFVMLISLYLGSVDLVLGKIIGSVLK